MSARPPDPPKLRVYTSEDVERMVRQEALEDARRPPVPPVEESPALVAPSSNTAPLTTSPRSAAPRTPGKAVRITRLALLVAYPLLTILFFIALPAALRADTSADPWFRLLFMLFLIGSAPYFIGAMLISCCLQFYFLGLFERKGLPVHWNILLSVCLGPIIALGLLRFALPLLMLILGKA